MLALSRTRGQTRGPGSGERLGLGPRLGLLRNLISLLAASGRRLGLAPTQFERVDTLREACSRPTMSSSDTEVAVDQCDRTGEPTMVGIKRKRSHSSGEEEGESKRKELLNGVVAADTQRPSQKEEENEERVVILDAGAQYGKVIDRRVRELCVESVILPLDTPAQQLQAEGYKAIIISGSPGSVNDAPPTSSSWYDPAIFSLGVPVLGVCYGMQLIGRHYGGRVGRGDMREDGQFSVKLDTDCRLFSGLEETQEVLLTHGDSVLEAPPTCRVVGYSGDIITALQHREREVYGVQFHPEVELSVNGTAMLRNFLFNIAGCKGHYTLTSRRQMCVDSIRHSVGDANVLSLVSGGVDSAVCTALLLSALGPDRVIAVHIDNGFMRKGESEQVKTSFEELGLKLHVYDAAQRFYTAQTIISTHTELGVEEKITLPLQSVTNPEEKRAIIGNTFMRVADEVMTDLQLESESVFLAQGTLRPDLIESASPLASARAHVIKTHHNDTQLVRELRKKGKVIEPLSEFHKDEVRVLGVELGLPHSLVFRHPFPGPGLAIRVLCQTESYIREDFATTNTVLGHIVSLGRSSEPPAGPVSQLLERVTSSEERVFLSRVTERLALHATLLPIYSVGVQGDCRSYNYVAALSSSDEELPWPDIMTIAKLIPKICHNINRVVWVFGSAVPGPVVTVTPTLLTRSVLSTLREADHTAHSILHKHGVGSHISQMPVILVPIDFSYHPESRPHHSPFQRAAVIRAFITSDFMTGVPAEPGKQLPLEVLSAMVTATSSVPEISRVLYDLTPKPPGTTEWE